MTRAFDYRLLDVFTDTAFAGNPLAVFPEAGGIPAEVMQPIATELNLPETVFVTAADAAGAGFDVRIMTPKTELPFAGHPVVGTAVALAARAREQDRPAPDSLRLRAPIGDIQVALGTRPDGVGWAAFTAPSLPQPVQLTAAPETLAAILGLPQSAVDEAPAPPQGWSAGLAFAVVPVATPEALADVAFDVAAWQRHLAGGPAPQVYPVVLDPSRPGEVQARMFAPALIQGEDPATGSAAAAFAGAYARILDLPDGRHEVRIRQGEAMGRPSRLDVRLEIAGGALREVRIAGTAVALGRGTLAPY